MEFRYQLLRTRPGSSDEALVRIDNCEGDPHIHLRGSVEPLGPISPEDAEKLFLEYARAI